MDEIKKLSEAIRLGSTFRPQCYGSLFEGSEDDKSCALGAAIEALGLKRERIDMRLGSLAKRFPELLSYCYRPINNIIGLNLTQNLGQYIIYLNDGKRLTREKIADWLEFNNY